jgi:hypothetical protein
MKVSRQKRAAWAKKLEGLASAKDKAIEDELVGIYEARQDGLSQADVAYMIGGVSPTGIKAKEDKGREIYERRKGGSGTS